MYCEAKESVKKSEKMDSVPGTIILSSGAAFLSLILMCSGGVGLIPTALLIFGSVKVVVGFAACWLIQDGFQEWKYFLLPWLVVSMMGMVFIVVCLGVNFREFAANPVLLVWFPCLGGCSFFWRFKRIYISVSLMIFSSLHLPLDLCVGLLQIVLPAKR